MAINRIKFSAKDVEDFAIELYDYIWTQHRFRSKSLEKIFAEKLSLMIAEPKKKFSKFNDNIGNAVLCSQYLLRGYCEFNFKSYEKDLVEDTNIFYVCIFDTIKNCIDKRKSIFFKVIDSAAIIAEVVLFCDAKLNTLIDLSRASVTFKNYFQTFLQAEFFENGGWDKLKSTALEYYHNLYLNLEPHMSSVNHPYSKLQHSCSLTTKLRRSPVAFPVEVNMTCNECKSRLEQVYLGFKYGSFFKYLMKDLNDGSIKEEDLFSKISSLMEGYSPGTSGSESKNEKLNDKYRFLYIYLGEKEQALLLAEESVFNDYMSKSTLTSEYKSIFGSKRR